MNSILTIGYEGAALEEVVATLKQAKVEVLIDVRALPLSRKKGFSKKAFSAALAEAGIAYRHLRDLGNPKPGREAARRGDMEGLREIFGAQLSTDAAEAALEEAGEVATVSRACLLCFERDPATCHRSMVAEELARRHGFDVHHLMAAR